MSMTHGRKVGVAIVGGALFSLLSLFSVAPVWAQQAPQKKVPVKLDRFADTHGFNVVLVLGDMQGGATTDNVPAAARKALADMKDFLPYKSYRLLDTAWILGSNRVSTRLRGLDEVEYELNLAAGRQKMGEETTLRVEFSLREPGREMPPAAADADALARAHERAEIEQRLLSLESDREKLKARFGEQHPMLKENGGQIGEAKQKLDRLGIAAKRGSYVISTGFSMDIGETVVVGTSRLRGGDKALIALLTAVPRGAK